RIVRLLGVTQVIVVITKIDLVDADLLALVKEEIEDFIAQSGFARAPVVCVSNETGEGIGEVKKAICQSIAVAEPSADQRAFRMYVRDVFSVKGYGTIATGVPCAGRIAVGAHLELLPAGRISRVRAIQTYRQDAQETGAHLSSAINLRDLQQLDLSRGMVLGAPGVYRAVSAALVWVKNDCDISRAQRSLKRRAELRFHSGTASTVAALELITGSELDAGEEGFALLRFRQPIVICAGDRFVLRMLSPADTLGGGVVLSANPPKRLRNVVFFADRLRRSLTAVEQGDFLGAELLAGARSVIHEEMLSSLAQTDKQAARALIGAKEKSGEVVMLAEGRWLVRERLEEIVLLLKKLLQRYHRENKYVWGMKPAHVTELLNLPPNSFALLQQLLGGDAEFAVKHGHLALKTFTPAINEREMKLRDAVIERVK
ncbi:MAG TPA: hypothetical protein PLP17_14865, partial [Oligoflexia bacterium]|nr:hypothetical protein [Oligoflexia bacterium]